MEVQPQNVVPRANHWIPEARANIPGLGERKVPTAAPRKRPEDPMERGLIGS